MKRKALLLSSSPEGTRAGQEVTPTGPAWAAGRNTKTNPLVFGSQGAGLQRQLSSRPPLTQPHVFILSPVCSFPTPAGSAVLPLILRLSSPTVEALSVLPLCKALPTHQQHLHSRKPCAAAAITAAAVVPPAARARAALLQPFLLFTWRGPVLL